MMGTESMMYMLAVVALGVGVLWSGNVDAGEGSSLPADVARVADSIHWLGHDAMRIDTDDTVIYIDPWQLGHQPRKADLVLITHDHRDHCSPEDVEAVWQDGAEIVTVAAAAEKLTGKKIHVVAPGDEVTVKGIAVEAVPSYNVNKFRSPGVPYHPKESGYVGFVITVGGVRIYHAGDTDVIEEMKDIRADIALVPVSGKYVMTAEEAVEAVRVLRPKLAIPMHVGRGIGSMEDARRFQELSPVPARVLPME
jgi:L-ascorbate metabolism protein UlaG (beta-lactamase superfamily)